MKARYVVDTNVLIAASAANPIDPKDIDATPRDPDLRRQVWQWLDAFSTSESKIVLDTEGKIYEEYLHKLGFNDFGIQVVMDKWSTAAVDNVNVAYDASENGVLPITLTQVVHDLADRKMVAAAIEAKHLHGEAPIAFAGDTDWHGWEDALKRHGVELEPIIEAWSRATYLSKIKSKKRR
jgi:hypothetical protein